MSRIGIETVLTMDMRLGYTHDVGKLHANWTEVARSIEDRPLHCTANKVSTHLVLGLPPFHFPIPGRGSGGGAPVDGALKTFRILYVIWCISKLCNLVAVICRLPDPVHL